MKRIRCLVMPVLALIFIVACASQPPAAAKASAAAGPAAAAAVPAIEPKLIDNCQGGGIGGIWDVYTDVKDNGGSSVVNPSPFVLQKDPGKGAKGSDGYAKCFGMVTTKYQYGFAGLTYDFTQDKSAFDMSSYTGFKFWMKGDGKTYNFAIKSPLNKDFDYYLFGIKTTPDWTEYTIPFQKFYQYNWGAAIDLKACLKSATGFQIQTIGQPIDKFEFDMDEVSLY